MRSQPYGELGKSSNGHRYGATPFDDGMISYGVHCQLTHYVHDEHDTFFVLVERFYFFIARCNPGQIEVDGGDHGKFYRGMRAIQKLSIQVFFLFLFPDVIEFTGAEVAPSTTAVM